MQIRRLKLTHFRGIDDLTWHPGPGVNCLVGPGDAGKTTVLDAISLLISPAPNRVAGEYDYFGGAISKGFEIDAVVGKLDDRMLTGWPVAPLWSWKADVQRLDPAPDPESEAVLVVRVKGTPELEVQHFALDPSYGEVPLSPSRRRKFGLSSIGSPGGAYRDLRMARGSLLSRNVDENELRSLAATALQVSRESFAVPPAIAEQINSVSERLADLAPDIGALNLAMLSPRGQNLLSLIALFSDDDGTRIPLSLSGRGTQQLALFALAEFLVDGAPMYVADEVESGLEPFRQRDLIARMRSAAGESGQVFISTHSPAVLESLQVSEIHRASKADGMLQIVALPGELASLKVRDPESLMCRLPVLVEGDTEVGLLTNLLERHAEASGTSLGALGVRIVDGGGQPKVFRTTEELTDLGIQFAVFLDTEDMHQGKRDALELADCVVFGTYTSGSGLEEALSSELAVEQLDELIATPVADGRDVTNSRLHQLNEATGDPGRKSVVALATQHSEEQVKQWFAEVANSRSWFKNRADAGVVADFLLQNSPEGEIVTAVGRFWSSLTELASLLTNKPETESAGPVD